MALIDVKCADLYLNIEACKQIKRVPIVIQDCPKSKCKFYKSRICRTCLRNLNQRDRFKPADPES